MKSICWTSWSISLAALCGCSYLSSQVDQEITRMAAQVQQIDIRPALDQVAAVAAQVQPPPPGSPATPVSTRLAPAEGTPEVPSTQPAAARAPTPRADLELAVALQQPEKKPEKKPPERLKIPPNLPGAKAPMLLPLPLKPTDAQVERYQRENYPPLPPLPQLRPPAPGPEGRPMTLADLQRLAAVYSPTIKSAEAAVEAAKGAAKQAGAYPNPNVFFEQDTVGTGSAGYEGFGFHQTIKTAGKLKLQQAAAMMDVLNAQLALKRAYIDVAYQVRTTYFAVLVAREGVKVNQALVELADEIYRTQISLIPNISAGYEPMQVRPLVLQARFDLIQSQNQYRASWRQLAAALGLRNMPLTELAGRVDMPVPVFKDQEVLARVLANHTDVRTAANSIQQARFNLQLAKVTNVPDVDLNVLGQKDYTAPPNAIVHSLQASMPIPIWNQNVGAIKQAAAVVAHNQAEFERTCNNLTYSLADAFNRYRTNRAYVATTTQQLQDQVRVFRHMYDRWFKAGGAGVVSFTDLVFTEQSLEGYISNYITALGLQWTAVCDIANLLQTNDLFQAGPKMEMVPVPDLKQLAPRPGLLPCAATPPPNGPQAGNATWRAGSVSDRSLPPVANAPGAADEESSQPAAPPAQPAPVAQPADTMDAERCRAAGNPKREGG